MKRRPTSLGAFLAIAAVLVATVAGCGSSAGAKHSAGASGSGAAAKPITSVPVQVAQTSAGAVAYRSDGHGTPLLLLMGYSGSMDYWQPSFVNALAQHYRVITIDNAGVGQTSPLPVPLTVTAMADQTAAFIDAERLGKVDVLGWSMGSLVTQALEIKHAALVNKAVLAASLPGDGKATSPNPAVQQQLFGNSNPAAALGLIFPPTAKAATNAYVKGILSYPHFYGVAPATLQQQQLATVGWIAGKEPAGAGITHVAQPTLVCDGSQDTLVPGANATYLAKAIPHASLKLYPGAGHAFLFQDQAAVVARVVSFLG